MTGACLLSARRCFSLNALHVQAGLTLNEHSLVSTAHTDLLDAERMLVGFTYTKRFCMKHISAHPLDKQ